MNKTRFITEAAIIAALYAVLTLINPFSSGDFQVRISEALTVLPFFTPAAIPGLFIGCFAANLFSPVPYDYIFGSLATLLAAYLTYKMPKKYLVPLPPIVVNAVIVALELRFAFNAPLLITMGLVALGQIIACYGLGYPLLLLLEKQKHRLFKASR